MPYDQTRYPPNWREISARIKHRDGNACQFCGVPNGAVGWRGSDGVFVQLAPSREQVGQAVDIASCVDGRKIITIVLTVAHLHDPDPANCDDENLGALCQRCHNRLDASMRRRNASATLARRKAAGMSTLFDGVDALFGSETDLKT